MRELFWRYSCFARNASTGAIQQQIQQNSASRRALSFSPPLSVSCRRSTLPREPALCWLAADLPIVVDFLYNDLRKLVVRSPAARGAATIVCRCRRLFFRSHVRMFARGLFLVAALLWMAASPAPHLNFPSHSRTAFILGCARLRVSALVSQLQRVNASQAVLFYYWTPSDFIHQVCPCAHASEMPLPPPSPPPC